MAYRKRIFLNPIKDGAPAFIQAVADSSDNGSYLLGNYLLIIADCERRITLEFSLANKYLRKRNLAKATRLAQVVNQFRDALAKEIASIEKNYGTPTTKKSSR
jgi:hypothetical protein